MRLRRSIRCALWAGALASFGARAGAQGGEREVAAQFFEAGAAAAKKGQYRVCAEAFSEAHKRAPHGATIYNAALCWESAKERARAANDYEQALDLGGLSQTQDEQARKRLAALRAKLGEITLVAPRGVRATAGPITGAPIPFSTYVEPGEIEVKLEGPDGQTVTRSVSVGAGDHEDVDLALPKEEPTEKPAAPKPDEREPATSGNLQRTAGWVVLGVSVVAAGVGGAYYMSALDAVDEFDKDRSNQTAHDRAESRYRTAQVFWIGAGIGAVAGATLILTAPKSKPKESAATLSLRLHATGASARLSF